MGPLQVVAQLALSSALCADDWGMPAPIICLERHAAIPELSPGQHPALSPHEVLRSAVMQEPDLAVNSFATSGLGWQCSPQPDITIQ